MAEFDEILLRMAVFMKCACPNQKMRDANLNSSFFIEKLFYEFLLENFQSFSLKSEKFNFERMYFRSDPHVPFYWYSQNEIFCSGQTHKNLEEKSLIGQKTEIGEGSSKTRNFANLENSSLFQFAVKVGAKMANWILFFFRTQFFFFLCILLANFVPFRHFIFIEKKILKIHNIPTTHPIKSFVLKC